ncbi:unnamed protein product, partial [Hymenolepis diminuta]
MVESDSGATAVTTPYPSSSSNNGSKNALPRLDSNQNAYTQTSCQESPIVINEEEGGGDSTSGANVDVDNDLETVKRERNELQSTLNKFERNVLEIQEEVRLLKSERDQLLLQIERAPKLNDRVKSPINLADHGQSSTEEILSLRKTLEKSVGELERAKITIHELEKHLEQMKLDLDRAISEKNEAEKAKGQLQTALSQTQNQNSALANELMMQKNMYNESVRGKQLSNSALSEAQRDLQVLNSRIKELETELR